MAQIDWKRRGARERLWECRWCQRSTPRGSRQERERDAKRLPELDWSTGLRGTMPREFGDSRCGGRARRSGCWRKGDVAARELGLGAEEKMELHGLIGLWACGGWAQTGSVDWLNWLCRWLCRADGGGDWAVIGLRAAGDWVSGAESRGEGGLVELRGLRREVAGMVRRIGDESGPV
jgi:hypothetical protein